MAKRGDSQAWNARRKRARKQPRRNAQQQHCRRLQLRALFARMVRWAHAARIGPGREAGVGAGTGGAPTWQPAAQRTSATPAGGASQGAQDGGACQGAGQSGRAAPLLSARARPGPLRPAAAAGPRAGMLRQAGTGAPLAPCGPRTACGAGGQRASQERRAGACHVAVRGASRCAPRRGGRLCDLGAGAPEVQHAASWIPAPPAAPAATRRGWRPAGRAHGWGSPVLGLAHDARHG